jgi:hypothetical protein
MNNDDLEFDGVHYYRLQYDGTHYAILGLEWEGTVRHGLFKREKQARRAYSEFLAGQGVKRAPEDVKIHRWEYAIQQKKFLRDLLRKASK